MSNVSQVVTHASAITIEELTPAAPNAQPRKLTLVGAGLPLRGTEWGFENNVKTTWYAGNPFEASQQNLGPMDNVPTTFNGEWRRTMLARSPARFRDESGAESFIVEPPILRDTLEDMGRAGQRLRVTWVLQDTSIPGSLRGEQKNLSADKLQAKASNREYRITRVGLVKTAKFTHGYATDVGWSVTWEWAGRGEKQARVATQRDDFDPNTFANDLSASYIALSNGIETKKIIRANEEIPRSAKTLTLGQLESIAETPTKLANTMSRNLRYQVNQVRRVGDLALRITNQPAQVAKVVVDFAKNTGAIARGYADQQQRRPIEENSNKQRVASLLRAHVYLGNITDLAIANAAASNELQRRFTDSVMLPAGQGSIAVRESATTRAGLIAAVYLAKAGDTPQKLSTRFYGNPDRYVDILRANRLPWYTPTFEPGKILVIPTLGSLVPSQAGP
jgi:hypothetical protein